MPRPSFDIEPLLEAPRPSRRPIALAFLLFFGSGAAALIYEVVWTRMLTTVLGSGIYAISVVLAAFMAGLAIGAAWIGRFTDRLTRPIVAYAVLELLIGLCGLVMPAVVMRFAVVDQWVYEHWGQNIVVLSAVRFVAVFGLLLVPATLMGGTLPIMGFALVRQPGDLGKHVGGLYAINTAGAVAGAFLTGFWLIGTFGVFGTEMAAAILNFLVAVCALVCLKVLPAKVPVERIGTVEPASAGDETRWASAPTTPTSSALALRLVLLAAFVTGAVSLAAQVIWSRALIFQFGELKNTTYCFSAMLTVFLAGLALGSGISSRLADHFQTPLRHLGLVLCVLGVTVGISGNVLLQDLPTLSAVDPATDAVRMPLAVAGVMWKTFLVIGIPTVLMGMTFPIALKAAVSVARLGREVGWLYASNTTGAVVGALLAPVAIIPLFGLTGSLFVLGCIDAGCGLMLLLPDRSFRVGLASAALLVTGSLYTTQQLLPESRHLQRLGEGESLLFYDEGPVATVAVIEDALLERRVSIDDVAVAGTSSLMQTDQKSLAHLGTLLAENPRTALTVGFGSGGASYSFLLHDRLEQVDCAEICPSVIRTAPYLTAANHGFLERGDRRYRIVFDDVSAYLRYTTQPYDIISSDCTDLKYKSSAGLYDREYFQSCRERLRPGGMVVAWMPLGGLSDETFRVALRTFYQVFPEMAIFYLHNEWTHYVLLLGWRDAMVIDFDRLTRRLEEADVRADLAEIGLHNPYKLLAAFVTSGRALDQYIAGATLNTRDHPVIEFEAPKYGYLHHVAQQNLLTLMKYRVSIRPWVVGTKMDWPRYQNYEQAVAHILEGQFHARNLNVEAATISFLRALRLTPDDDSLRQSLQFPWLVRLARQGNPTAWLLLGRSQQLQGNAAQALEFLDRYDQILADYAAGTQLLSPDMERQARAWRPTAKTWREECVGMLTSKPSDDGSQPANPQLPR